MVKANKSRLELTAYLTSCERAMFPEISSDIYAKHWIPDEAWQLLDEFLRCEDFSPKVIAARNRYFLERMKKFFSDDPGLLINFAAGMSSYPFLLGKQIEHIEIDSSEMLEHKKQLRRRLENEGILPRRPVSYINYNLNDKDVESQITNLFKGRRQNRLFILFEGIVYYLDRERFSSILKTINQSICGNDRVQVGIVYWDYSCKNHPFLIDYNRFINKISGKTFVFNYYSASDFEKLLSNCHLIDSGTFKELLTSYDGVALEKKFFTEHYVTFSN